MTELIPIVEWFWTLIALLGVGTCIWAISDSVADRADLVSHNLNGDARLNVKMNLRQAKASILLHVFFFVLGVFALATPDNPAIPPFTYILLAGSYITVAVTNVRAVFLNQIDRVKIRRGANGTH